MSATSSYFRTQKGNVLFMILLAVALFAALSYAVTNSTRSGGGDISREKATLYASQITQYGASLESAVQRMRISNNCLDTQISFENNQISGYTNATSPPNYGCHAHRPEGGNIPLQIPPTDFLDTTKSSYPNYGQYVYTVNYVSFLGTDDNPTGRELMVVLPYVKKEVCVAINDKLGIGTKGADPRDANDYMGSALNWNGKWQGTYLISGAGYIDRSEFRGMNSGCTGAGYEFNSGASVGKSYLYFHTLIVR